MSIRLKICGITTLEDARYCAARGADYLGFVQHEPSPRYVAAPAAAEIIEWVYGPAPVGVFVDATAEHVNRTADQVGFDLVQLHGDEPVFEVASIERPVIKALRVGAETSVESLRRRFREYEDVVEYFLLDTYSRDLAGGTGTAFDWSVAETLMAEYDIFVAGGLNATNVAEAVDRLRPFAIDVSSSLESSPGKKDFGRIDTFMDAFDHALGSRRIDT